MLFIIKIYQATADCFSFTKGHSCFYYLMTNSLIEWEGALLILWRHYLSLTKLTFSLLSFFLSSLQNVFLSFYRFFLRLSFFLSIYLSIYTVPICLLIITLSCGLSLLLMSMLQPISSSASLFRLLLVPCT